MDLPIREREQSETTDYDSRRTVNGSLDTGSTPVYSTTPCFDEHLSNLSIKVYKTRIYLICGFRNPYEAESEKWQNIGLERRRRFCGIVIKRVCFWQSEWSEHTTEYL